jgi:hypothetical protein
MKQSLTIVLLIIIVFAIAGLIYVVDNNGQVLRQQGLVLNTRPTNVALQPSVQGAANSSADDITQLRKDFDQYISWARLSDENSLAGYWWYWQGVNLDDKGTGKNISFKIPKQSTDLLADKDQLGLLLDSFPADAHPLAAYEVSPVDRSGEAAVIVMPSTAANDAAYLCTKDNLKPSNSPTHSFNKEVINGNEFCEQDQGDCGAGSCGNTIQYVIKENGNLIDFVTETYGSTCSAYDDPNECAPFIDGVLNNIVKSLKIE